MAATLQARQLTEAHRLAQARIGAQTVAGIRATWPLLDAVELDATMERWLTAVIAVIRGQHAASARLAANYLATFKALEIRSSTMPTVTAVLNEAAVTTSMIVTGPVRVKQAMTRAGTLARAMATAESTSAAAAMRHALDGGRTTITATVNADPQALGWARATSGQPCAFCAMVASRGPVYKEERTADFEPHDGCNCSAEPVYRRDAAWPAGSERLRQLWEESQSTGDNQMSTFRALVESS